MPSHWYESYFDGLAVELWRSVPTGEATQAEVDFLERELRIEPGARVLDIPCGDGRHSAGMAGRGYRVTGFDISEAFLEMARQRPEPVEWIQGNMVDPPPGPFDAAYCWGNSFGYLPYPEIVQSLRNLHGVLKPGARFVLETGMSADTLLPVFAAHSEFTVGEIKMITDRVYDCREGRMRNRYTFIKGDITEVKDMDQGVFTCAELVRMFQNLGFEVDSLYSGTGREPFEFGARRLILSAICLPRPSTEPTVPSLP